MSPRNFIAVCLPLIFSCATVQADMFSTGFCDFSVSFPGKYETREMIGDDATGIAAVANATADTRLAAECWPNSFEITSLADYARAMQSEMVQRGFEINSVSIDRNSGAAPIVIIAARLNAGGEKYYTTTISHVGPQSRLDLTIVERKPASAANIAFRNSVRMK